jgi:hypothetical protein
MSRLRNRDELTAQLARELPNISAYEIGQLVRRLMRAGTTLQRLAEAQCNGDYPYDNGERKVEWCSRCQSGCTPHAMKRYEVKADTVGVDTVSVDGKTYYQLCPDCRLQDRVTKLLAGYGMRPIFNGDPRGAVFLVIPPSYEERNKGRDVHNLEGIYVS